MTSALENFHKVQLVLNYSEIFSEGSKSIMAAAYCCPLLPAATCCCLLLPAAACCRLLLVPWRCIIGLVSIKRCCDQPYDAPFVFSGARTSP